MDKVTSAEMPKTMEQLAQDHSNAEKSENAILKAELASMSEKLKQANTQLKEHESTLESLKSSSDETNELDLVNNELEQLRNEVDQLGEANRKRQEIRELRKKANKLKENGKLSTFKPNVYGLDSMPTEEGQIRTVVYKHAVEQLQVNRPELDLSNSRVKDSLERYVHGMTMAITLKQKNKGAWNADSVAHQAAALAQSASLTGLRIKSIIPYSSLSKHLADDIDF